MPAGPSAQPTDVGRELPQLQKTGALDDIRKERLAAERKQKAAETDETRAQKQRAKNLEAMARLEREERELAHHRRALAWGLIHTCDPSGYPVDGIQQQLDLDRNYAQNLQETEATLGSQQLLQDRQFAEQLAQQERADQLAAAKLAANDKSYAAAVNKPARKKTKPSVGV